jgi:hypothetical protein
MIVLIGQLQIQTFHENDVNERCGDGRVSGADRVAVETVVRTNAQATVPENCLVGQLETVAYTNAAVARGARPVHCYQSRRLCQRW